MANLKIDAVFFALGLLAGIGAFGLGLPLYEEFWQHSGYMGRLTLSDWTGIGVPWIVAGVVVMAVGCFYGAGFVERWATAFRKAGGLRR